MTKLEDFLSVRQILAEEESAINGKLTVVKELAWGTHIMAGGITQSGGIAQDIWKTTFKRLGQKEFKNVLILGLGGGGIAKLVSKYWPEAQIAGVEIDPVIIELGRKYLGLDKMAIKTHIEDGYIFIQKQTKQKNKFDLVCIDTYIGQEFPKKFEDEKFLENILKILDEKGVAVFNRLYYKEKIQQAYEFKKKLENIFPKVEVVKPEANIMFLCSHS